MGADIGHCAPAFWDSPSFAQNLEWAFHGFERHPKFAHVGRLIFQKSHNENVGLAQAPGDVVFAGKNALQKSVYCSLMDNWIPNSSELKLATLIEDRVYRLLSPHDFDFNVQNCLEVLKAVSSIPLATKVIKTWLNGWISSYRMREDTLHNCLLGCREERDSLQHYLQCPTCTLSSLF